MQWALVADYDERRAAMTVAAVRDAGLEPIYVRDGESARHELETRGAPALVVTDLSLPRRDGFAVLGDVRTRGARTPAVAIGGSVALRTHALAKRELLGIVEVLPGTFQAETLRRALRRALGPVPAPPVDPRLEVAAAKERERRRLDGVAALSLVDDLPPEESLQQLLTDVAKTFGVPVALVSLVLEDRQWFKAHVGLEGSLLRDRGSKREWSFCSHVVEESRVLVVPDARTNPAFSENPYVVDGTIRGYAGMPLMTADGLCLGTLCVLDSQPLNLPAERLDELALIARRVAGEIELRYGTREGRDVLRAPDIDAATAHAWLVTILGNLDAGVMLIDAKRRSVFVNRALGDLLDVASPSLLGRTRDEIIARLIERAAAPEEARRLLRAPSSGAYSARADVELARPHPRWIRWSAKPVALREGTGQLCLFQDVTAEIELNRMHERNALTDSLTGLANRRAFDEMIATEAARATRQSSPIAFVVFDIDHFKKVNDIHGHAVGDDVLKATAAAIAASARPYDLVARWGGEEFVAVLPQSEIEGAVEFAERARTAVAAATTPRVTISAGVAAWLPPEDPAATFARADAKLLEAKRTGRDRVLA